MDLISELPKEIKHSLICLLPEKEAARSSVLSKSWKLCWDSRPFLVFREENLRPGAGGSSFADSLVQSLRRFSENQVSVEELRVFMDRSPSPETVDAVSRWVQLAARTNLGALELSVEDGSSTRNLLDSLSSDTLTTLSLTGCKLTAAGPGRSWRLPRLRTLSLSNPTLIPALPTTYESLVSAAALEDLFSADPAAIEDLVSACPSLEQLELRLSSRMSRLKLSGIGRLKRVKVVLDKGLGRISLAGAASLESFTCCGTPYGVSSSNVSDIALEGCEESLKELRLSFVNLSSDWGLSQIPKFRALKVLALKSIRGLDSLKISSTELTELLLHYRLFRGTSAEIYAPNLRKLEFTGAEFLIDSLVASRSLESVNFDFFLYKEGEQKAVLFHKLKQLLHQINHIDNVMVTFTYQLLKIAIVHEGHSDSLLDVLSDLYDLMTLGTIRISISSESNWLRSVVSPLYTDIVYLASSFDNNHNRLSEYLSKELSGFEWSPNASNKNVGSIATVTENYRPGFGDGVDSIHAALQVYRESPFRLTRFALSWPPPLNFSYFFHPNNTPS